jgi:flagellar protein FliL
MTMTEDAPPVAGEQASSPSSSDAAAHAADKSKKGKKAKKDKSGRSNLVPAIVLAIGVAAAGYFMGSGGTSAEAVAPAGAETIEAAPVPGEFVEVEPMTLNLDGGRFLRVGVSFLTVEGFEAIDGDPHKGEPARFYPEHASKLRDQLIAMFGGREVSTLLGAEGLEAAKTELLERANVVLDDQVLEVYFVEFVMQ